MKSPCLACNVHLKGANKNNDRCRTCRDRAAYVASLGGMFGSVPDRHCDFLSQTYGGDMKPDKIKHADLDIRVCKDCEKTFEGPQVAENFARSARSSDGLMKVCKACHGLRIAAGHAKKPANQKAAGKPAAAPSNVIPGGFKKQSQGTGSASADDPVRMLLKGHPEVLSGLEAMAAYDLRPVHTQAVYIIKRTLERFSAAMATRREAGLCP